MANRIPGDPIPGSIPWGMILRDEATKVTLVQMLWGALCPTMGLFSCRCPVTGPPLLLCLRLTAEPLVASSIRQDFSAQSLLPDETCPESGVSTNHHTLLTPPFQNCAPYLQLSLLSFIIIIFYFFAICINTKIYMISFPSEPIKLRKMKYRYD